MGKGIHPTLKLDETEDFKCQGLSKWQLARASIIDINGLPKESFPSCENTKRQARGMRMK